MSSFAIRRSRIGRWDKFAWVRPWTLGKRIEETVWWDFREHLLHEIAWRIEKSEESQSWIHNWGVMNRKRSLTKRVSKKTIWKTNISGRTNYEMNIRSPVLDFIWIHFRAKDCEQKLGEKQVWRESRDENKKAQRLKCKTGAGAKDSTKFRQNKLDYRNSKRSYRFASVQSNGASFEQRRGDSTWAADHRIGRQEVWIVF